MSPSGRRRTLVAAALAASLTATACADSSGSDDEGAGAYEKTGVINQRSAPEPARGGTLTMGMYAETNSLDPTIATGSGTAGGTELLAIYDALMRFNAESGEYEPKMAKSLRSNDDNTAWTLKLREGVSFSDGATLDADAVEFSIDRYIDSDARYAALVDQMVDRMKTPDDTTVVFELAQPWAGFPWMLAYSPGNIVSPKAAKEHGEDFQDNPVGAGPFEVQRHAPGEEIVLTARDDYWGGRPYLDELRFVALNGARATYDALKSGQLQAGYLRDPEVNQQAIDENTPGYSTVENLGATAVINNREGRPGEDKRVRQAMAAAVDPEVVNQRSYSGKGLPGNRLFREPSERATETAGVEHDQERAKRLLNEAKSDGYDGKLQLVSNKTSTSSQQALALQAMLEAVGFDVTVDSANTLQQHIRKVLVDRKFDIATYGMTTADEAPWVGLQTNLDPDSPGNVAGYENKDVVALLDELQRADTPEAKQAAIEKLQKHWNENVPSLILAASPAFIAWDENVHGVQPTTNAMMMFDKAFIAQE